MPGGGARANGGLLDRLTQLAAETAFEDLPTEAVRATATFLLDSLAVGVAGSTGPYRDEMVRTALAWGAGGGARVLGDGLAVPPPPPPSSTPTRCTARSSTASTKPPWPTP